MIPNATLPRRPPARVSRHHAWNNPGTSASPYRARNVAFGAGGGESTFDNSAGSIGFRSCLFRDNDGGSGGGAIDARAGTASIEATEFCTNAPTQLQGSIVDLGGNTFGYDCNSNGICDLE